MTIGNWNFYLILYTFLDRTNTYELQYYINDDTFVITTNIEISKKNGGKAWQESRTLTLMAMRAYRR